MNAGKLRHRVLLQQRTSSIDTFGQQQYTWSDIATVWAEIRTNVGGESLTSDTLTIGKTISIIIRFRTDLTEEMRATTLRDGRTFYVNDIQDEYGTRRKLTLSCVENL